MIPIFTSMHTNIDSEVNSIDFTSSYTVLTVNDTELINENLRNLCFYQDYIGTSLSIRQKSDSYTFDEIYNHYDCCNTDFYIKLPYLKTTKKKVKIKSISKFKPNFSI